MKNNERLQALHILITLVQKNRPLSHLMTVSPPLSPFSKELCFGVCRHYFRMEALANRLVKTKPKSIEIWICLLMGLYQLHILHIPDHAVVQETVALTTLIKKPWAKGLVNAVLRTYCREKEALLASMESDGVFQYGHPEWLMRRLQNAWPDDWQKILTANDAHPPMSLRVNAQHFTAPLYIERLLKANISASCLKHAPSAILLKTPCNVHELPGFAEGDVSVQDEAGQLAVSLLSLKPGLRVLDACTAPGGKLCHILETESELATCVALDIDASRLNRVQENLTRIGLRAVLLNGDALNPKTWWDGLLFDRILLDAPCSATGVIRRHPDIKRLRTETEIQTVVETQHNLLQALWPLLAPNGLMVYATCSVIPEENELQIARFVASQPDCQCDMQEQPWGRNTGHGRQILPGEHGMDGFFYCRFRKYELS
ncbi:MAG: 16S rRNA (cytosine(967)-C(5))-methyltransferase RsmB [Legionellales bacterium]|nr:16S rRNA (cytosine(967)-C(5))-methyltransferase RsmB [Legionellales bacterium]